MEPKILINDAIELLMQLRVKSEKEKVNEKELYDVQMLLYKSLDRLPEPVSNAEKSAEEIKQLMFNDIEEFVSIYMKKVGSVDKKEIIEHDLREGISIGLIVASKFASQSKEVTSEEGIKYEIPYKPTSNEFLTGDIVVDA